MRGKQHLPRALLGASISMISRRIHPSGANLGLSYRIETGIGAFVPRLDGSYRSKTYFDAANTEQIAQEGYEVYNAALRYIGADERLSITAGVTNFTDEEYRVSGNSSLTAASGYAEVVYAPPSQWFLEAAYSF
jgi:iron complex outermembrane recepter protein